MIDLLDDKDENAKRLKDLIDEAINKALGPYIGSRSHDILVSRKAAAKRLGVDESTLWRWDRCGYLKVTSRIGRHVFYSEDVLRRLERGELSA